jgi:photosystem II stability/assembly factor-like uncharacterized protein
MARLIRMHRLALFAALLLPVSVYTHAQWNLEMSNTTADLRGIHSIGNGVAWASGTNGTVLRTEDGGYVWQSCSIPPGAEHLDFRGIQAFDANTAIVMSSGKGDLSRLYKTTDGCHTWNLVAKNPDPDGFWDAMRTGDPEDTTHINAMDESKERALILGDSVDSQLRTENSNSATRSKAKAIQAKALSQRAIPCSRSFRLLRWTRFGNSR